MRIPPLFVLGLFVVGGMIIGNEIISEWRDAHTFYIHAKGVPAGMRCEGTLTSCEVMWMEGEAAHRLECTNAQLYFWHGEPPRGGCVVTDDPAPLTIVVKP